MASVNPGTTDLLAWWILNEASGNRADSHGSYTLTDVNTVGTAEGGADFDDDNDEHLESASGDLSWADEPVTWTGWIWLDDVVGDNVVMSRWGAAGDRQYQLRHDDSDNNWQIHISDDGTASIEETNDTKGNVTGEWIFWAWWHDPVNDRLGLRINATTEDRAYADGLSDDTDADVCLGRRDDGLSYLDGKEKVTNVWNAVLTSDNLDWLYNGGTARSYSDAAGEITVLASATMHRRTRQPGSIEPNL